MQERLRLARFTIIVANYTMLVIGLVCIWNLTHSGWAIAAGLVAASHLNVPCVHDAVVVTDEAFERATRAYESATPYPYDDGALKAAIAAAFSAEQPR